MASSDTESSGELEAPPPPLPPANSSSSSAEKQKEEAAEVGGTLDCSKCGDNCWEKGWFLAAAEEDGSTNERKSLCDDCFLFAPDIKGADRCLKGKLKIIAKKEKKPKVAKKATKTKH